MELKIRDKRSRGWFRIDVELIKDHGKTLGPIGIAVYNVICLYADNDSQQCRISLETLAGKIGISERSVRTYVKILEKLKIINVFRERNESTKVWKNQTYILLDKNEWVKQEESEVLDKPPVTYSGGYPPALGSNGSSTKPQEIGSTTHRNVVPNNIDFKDIKTKTDLLCYGVLDYLNEKAEKHFKPIKAHFGFISARIRDGATFEDFQTVIDKKTLQWKNTDRDMYIRPKTLFAPSNFDAYLNEKEVKSESRKELDKILYGTKDF